MYSDWLMWFTRMENSKPLALVLFFAAFCAIVLYVYTGRRRGKRLESYKHIPFQDEAATPDSPFRKVTDDERENN